MALADAVLSSPPLGKAELAPDNPWGFHNQPNPSDTSRICRCATDPSSGGNLQVAQMRFSENFELSQVDLLWIAALSLASVLLYIQTLGFDFVEFDDHAILVNHPARYNESSLTESVRQIFVEDFPREEPLVVRDLSWALDARLFGFDNASAYHRTNVALNAVVAGLLFLFLRRLRLPAGLAGAVGIAFVALPIHIEVVSWVMGRKDLLVSIFILIGLLAQHEELDRDRPSERLPFYLITLACLGLAMGSKVSAISFWIVLGAHRFFHPYLTAQRSARDPVHWRADGMRTVPPLVPHILLSLTVFVWYRARLAEFGIIESGETPAALSVEHLTNMFWFQPLIALQYLQHLFMPGELSSFYRWPHVSIPLTRIQQIGSLLSALGLSSAVAYCLWRRRDLAFYVLWPLALLAPYAGFFYVGFWHADRYLYLASAGLLTVVALLIRDLVMQMPSLRNPAIAMVTLFTVLGAVHVWEGQNRWRDNESLWLYESSREDPSLMSFYALGRFYAERAENAKGEERRELALITKVIVDRGLARLEELDLQPTNYPTPEIGQAARLHSLSGLTAGILGAPPLMRANHYRRAYAASPDMQSAILLSGALVEAAQALPSAEKQVLVEESFTYFQRFIALSAADPIKLKKSSVLLEKTYGDRYPYLASRIAEAKRIYYP